MANEIEHITDHAQRAIDLLMEQFRECDNVTGLVTLFVDEMQEAEDMLFSLVTGRALETAEGVQLDRLGDIVGEPRRGNPDSEYRVFIEFKVLQNLAQGEPERVIRVAQILTGATVVRLTEPSAGRVRVYTDGDILTSNAETLDAIDAVLPAGVALELVLVAPSPTARFSFANNGLLNSGGFSSVNAPGSGGVLAGIVSP